MEPLQLLPVFHQLQKLANTSDIWVHFLLSIMAMVAWSAIDESDTYITMLDDTTFQIVGADATYLDPDTYEISSTNVGEQN